MLNKGCRLALKRVPITQIINVRRSQIFSPCKLNSNVPCLVYADATIHSLVDYVGIKLLISGDDSIFVVRRVGIYDDQFALVEERLRRYVVKKLFYVSTALIE